MKKLYQSSKPGEAKPRQSIGATKSALGAQGKEHQNKDLVQLELTINSSPYNGAESTSRQNRPGAADGDKDDGGMKRNSSLDTHPMPQHADGAGPASSSRFAHVSSASKGGGLREAAPDDAPTQPGATSAAQDPRTTAGRVGAQINNLVAEDSDENKQAQTQALAQDEGEQLLSSDR